MNIIIIGGTSGIGFSLAQHYLDTGHTVTVCGRDLSKIPETSAYLQLNQIQLDVTIQSELSAFFLDQQDQVIDILIYCAGKYFNERRLTLNTQETEQLTAVNSTAFKACFDWGAKKMQAQKHGHLVTIASVAGLVRSAQPTLYGNQKAHMITYAGEIRNQIKHDGVNVTVIAPGYINTEKLRALNGGDASRKPFLISEQRAVQHIIQAIDRNKSLAVFPMRMKWLIKSLNLLPLGWVTQVLNRRR
ncbi:SDR family NAD(P)-dependent oxidoreductase [Vibrio profundum]|uniref:SDR family NAD(P)-dependent oxidoreductase n=1 Tax=Vibrio profundum TaxID=2910247 RepID=UPI003D0B29C9